MSTTAAPVVMVLPQDWEARTLDLLRRALAEHAQKQELARHPLSAQEAADTYAAGSLSRWRSLRFDYPEIDKRAALGPPGRLRRWDAEKLAAVMGELQPGLRRQRRRAAKAAE